MATLDGMVTVALGKIGAGHAAQAVSVRFRWRYGGPSFQRWYDAQTSAGNRLVGARQVWTFGAGPDQQAPIYWALHVRVYVAAEDRIKSNEVVISRPDISVVALYQRGAILDDSIVVLVREYRSPASPPMASCTNYPAARELPRQMFSKRSPVRLRRRPGSPSALGGCAHTAAATLRPPCPSIMLTCSRPSSPRTSLPGCALPSRCRTASVIPNGPERR